MQFSISVKQLQQHNILCSCITTIIMSNFSYIISLCQVEVVMRNINNVLII